MEEIKSILIVSDCDQLANDIHQQLRTLIVEFSLIRATSHYQTMDLLTQKRFDLCLLDESVDNNGGFSVLKNIDEHDLSIPVVLLTEIYDKQYYADAIRSGAQDTLEKGEVSSPAFEKCISYAKARKALELSRLKNQQIRAESTSKDKFISHLSHELRTPLTSILGYTDLLLENPVAAPINKELKIIDKNGKHLLNLLNDVLDLSKLFADKFELQAKPCDLRLVLADLHALLAVSASDKGIDLIIECNSLLDSHPVIDETRLKQVLLNIMGNAIKFTDRGHVKLSVSQPKGGQTKRLNIVIEDTGIGIAESKKAKIFEPFSQLEDVNIRKSGGAGLGLAISTEIVGRMNGKLDVSSVVGLGTTFTLEIPFEPSDISELKTFDLTVDYNERTEKILPSLDGKILIVDDIFEIRQLVGALAKKTGLSVSTAKNGFQALEKLSIENFDLILLDLQMPGMTGQELVSKLPVHIRKTPIIAMTASNLQHIQSELFSLGFVGAISKPIDSQMLFRVLNEHLALSKKQGEESSVQRTKVLLIEDDEDSAHILSLIIKQSGLEVFTARRAEEAETVLKEHDDDSLIIITDLNIGEFTGEKLLSFIRNLHTQSPLAIISGEQPDMRLNTEYTVRSHLVKPVSKAVLLELVSDLIQVEH